MQRPWVKSYPQGVRADPALEISAIGAVLTRARDIWPDQAAVEFMGRRISYAELDRLVDRAAKGFQSLGVKPGVHVGLFLPNCPQFLIAFFAVLRAGGTIVNYSPLDAAATLEHKIADSRTEILVSLDLQALYPQIAGVLDRTNIRRLILGDLAEFSAAPAGVRAHLTAARQIAEVAPDPRHMSFAALIDNDGVPAALPAMDPRTAIAVLQYTGGTTGKPKGAILTHANLTAAMSEIEETTRASLTPGDVREIVVLPLFHIYALTVVLLLGVRLGAELVLHVRFDVEAVLKDLETKNINVLLGVPTMFIALLNHPSVKPERLRNLGLCSSGGAPLPQSVSSAFHQMTGKFLREGWGMTETSAIGTFTPVGRPPKLGSCGIPAPAIDMKFLSVEDGKTYLPYGQRGEICVRGPNIMEGYWNNPQATRETMTEDGYLRTGDVGWMDDEGYVFIVDRTKDMILCGGFNVYPRNIEEAIYQHPAVDSVSVIGIPDPYRGQSPKAFIKLKAGAPEMSLEEMKTFLKDKLGRHEMIAQMEIRPELPRTLVGKLSKKELYEEEAKKRGEG
jgi:long-chain acyl-CoA synthetase